MPNETPHALDWRCALPSLSSNKTPPRYTAQRWDTESGLYYYRTRYYSPSLGRFLTTDPIGYGDGLNVYAYVGNDPVNSNDPSGLLAAQAVRGAIAGYTIVRDNPHEALDVAGPVPALGTFPDLLNASGYALQGDYANAGVSLAAAVPILGQGATAGKYASKIVAIGRK